MQMRLHLDLNCIRSGTIDLSEPKSQEFDTNISHIRLYLLPLYFSFHVNRSRT